MVFSFGSFLFCGFLGELVFILLDFWQKKTQAKRKKRHKLNLNRDLGVPGLYSITLTVILSSSGSLSG